MKVKTVEIAWHRRPEATHNDPVLSVDFLNETVFATGGGDHEVKIWKLNTSGEEPVVEFCYSLRGHTQSVNVVRFSPDRKLLASAGDDGCIIIWKLRPSVCHNWCEITKENCFEKKIIRGHAMDIYDISWSPTSQFLVSSGTDSNIIIWGIDGTQYARLHDHSGYIQGIDWSRDDVSILSVANDRTARVYSYARGRVNPCLQTEDLAAFLGGALRSEFRISRNVVHNKPLTCRAVLKKRLFGAEGEAEGEAEGVEGAEGVGDEGLAAVISTPEAPILTPPSKRGNGGNQSEKPAGNQSGNQGNQSENQGNSGNQTENQSENHGGNQGNGGNAGENPGEEGTGGKGGARGYFMFLGDTVPSFYRRPHSSFDGLLTAIPCGVTLDKEGGVPRNCTYVYLNGVFEKPLFCLPVFSLPTVVCRFSPVRYARDSRGKSMVGSVSDVIGCEYAHVLAVTTTEEVFLYRTDELGPRFYVGNIHYAQICDFAWSADGKFALTASSDGYCTLFQFEKGDLGDLGAVRS